MTTGSDRFVTLMTDETPGSDARDSSKPCKGVTGYRSSPTSGTRVDEETRTSITSPLSREAWAAKDAGTAKDPEGMLLFGCGAESVPRPLAVARRMRCQCHGVAWESPRKPGMIVDRLSMARRAASTRLARAATWGRGSPPVARRAR